MTIFQQQFTKKIFFRVIHCKNKKKKYTLKHLRFEKKNVTFFFHSLHIQKKKNEKRQKLLKQRAHAYFNSIKTNTNAFYKKKTSSKNKNTH